MAILYLLREVLEIYSFKDISPFLAFRLDIASASRICTLDQLADHALGQNFAQTIQCKHKVCFCCAKWMRPIFLLSVCFEPRPASESLCSQGRPWTFPITASAQSCMMELQSHDHVYGDGYTTDRTKFSFHATFQTLYEETFLGV